MGKRLTNEERARRDAVYQVWAKNEMDFVATSKATGVEEKELRRWYRVHQWWKRWAAEQDAELAKLQQVADEIEQLAPLVKGITVDGNPLYISSEIKLDAASLALEKMIGLGGEIADQTREHLKPAIPGAVITLTCIARGVNRDGQQVEVSIKDQEDAQRAVLGTGIVTKNELDRLPIQDLFELIRKRLREQGLDPIVH